MLNYVTGRKGACFPRLGRPAIWLLAVVVFLAVCWFTWPGQAQAPVPGSEADPLVSKSYLESRLAECCSSLEATVAELTRRVNELEQQVRELRQQQPSGPSGEASIVLRVGSLTANVRGGVQSLEEAPYIEGGAVMVPFRFIGQAIGARLTWDNQRKAITYRLGSTELLLQVGQPWVEVNGERRPIGVAPCLVGNTTMVPLRVVSEYLGARVIWDAAKKEITVRL